jgi:SlyX protein
MSEERFVDIEVKLAHQEQVVNELNEVVTQQQAKLMQLEELCTSLLQRVRSIGESSADPEQDERPPHY